MGSQMKNNRNQIKTPKTPFILLVLSPPKKPDFNSPKSKQQKNRKHNYTFVFYLSPLSPFDFPLPNSIIIITDHRRRHRQFILCSSSIFYFCSHRADVNVEASCVFSLLPCFFSVLSFLCVSVSSRFA
ncbi:hypothetical protein RND81_03G105700 [Saponaria officinalis]|uniref:Transmembrane protein n=1 Tax=Saponaria officinalis TaxID=3572 RepID=A0AAW1M2P1_SAPOF